MLRPLFQPQPLTSLLVSNANRRHIYIYICMYIDIYLYIICTYIFKYFVRFCFLSFASLSLSLYIFSFCVIMWWCVMTFNARSFTASCPASVKCGGSRVLHGGSQPRGSARAAWRESINCLFVSSTRQYRTPALPTLQPVPLEMLRTNWSSSSQNAPSP